MTDTDGLVLAICEVIKISEQPVPIEFKNYSAELASFVIVAVAERCSQDGIGLRNVCVDPNGLIIWGLRDGANVAELSRATVKCETGLRRQVRFDK